ncbi:hypothetical protein P4U44_11120 [Alkalihalobacillus alcalophilus]|uniref:hypothetical protein n=1 Tax=Alkalihalobacillus alcalophilus TaxID=1445 RepID=UPI0010A5A915|nr:hypothetical protein [Alkalihalobacillus alcalophilus]MED1562444.1 hypothetical protein [Alkalihalobacillus alcalophilus]
MTLGIQDWEEYLNSSEYIEEYFETAPNHDKEGKILGIKMNGDFYNLDLIEQYLYITNYISEYYKLFPTVIQDLDIGYLVYIFKGEYVLPTYVLGKGGIYLEAVNSSVHYVESHSHEYNFDVVSDYINGLSKDEVLNGTKAGLTKEQWDKGEMPVINATTVRTSGEIEFHGYTGFEPIGEISNLLAEEAQELDKSDSLLPDSETYLDDMTGNEWIMLSDNQKFHGVSNALYHLDLNGFKVHETEQFFIDALNEFYTDSSTMSTNALDALASIGKMSGTMTK